MNRASLPLRLAAATLLVAGLTGWASSAEARKKRLDAPTAASGLKEALSLGTSEAVELLSAVDGYLKNDAIRIQAPKGLKMVEKGLRAMGQDELVDEFVISMNRAAEAAAPLAKEVFLDAIRAMSFEDAVKIVRGGDHSATDYLEESSRDHLHELFRPIVAGKLEEVGATAAFNDLVDRHLTMPFAGRPAVDLEGHVTDGALDGLFHVVALQEENIRTNVVARTSDILEQVFGSREARAGDGAASEKPRWWERY